MITGVELKALGENVERWRSLIRCVLSRITDLAPAASKSL